MCYIRLNRWATIQPPSKALIEASVAAADISHGGRLNRTEFRLLAALLLKRGIYRVAPFVVGRVAINFLVGPLLAYELVRLLHGRAAVACVGACLYRPTALFMRTSLTVLFVRVHAGRRHHRRTAASTSSS